MTIVVKLTTAGADSGPFDLYSDANAYCCTFASDVPKADLIEGYSTTAPDNTTMVKVFSTGACTGSVVFIPTGITTTSSSSSSTSTTTSSTTNDFNITAAYENMFAACNLNFVGKVYFSGTLVNQNTIYTDVAMTSPFVGNIKWYWIKGGTAPWQIDSNGKLMHPGFCVT